MTATTIPAEIAAFAAGVRGALADLPADEVEELTDGLEADLTEAYSEDLARELPDPAGYAMELRNAAGLPLPQGRGSRLRDVASSFAGMGRDLNGSLRKSPAMSTVLDFLVTLRPAWWIVRGWAAYQFAVLFTGAWKTDLIPASPMYVLVLLAVIAGSVAVGLRSWPRWVRVLIVLGNVVAVWATLWAVANVTTGAELQRAYDDAATYYPEETGSERGAGVFSGDTEVTNIFAYDAAGKPISGVQLFDQDGQPLQTSTPGGNGCLVWLGPEEDDACETAGAWVPSLLETGATVWNVYPMQMAESTFEDPTKPVAGAVPQDRPAPFIKVSALQSAITSAPADATKKGSAEEKAKNSP